MEKIVSKDSKQNNYWFCLTKEQELLKTMDYYFLTLTYSYLHFCGLQQAQKEKSYKNILF